jgi:hypothetical protein
MMPFYHGWVNIFRASSGLLGGTVSLNQGAGACRGTATVEVMLLLCTGQQFTKFGTPTK